MAGTRFSTRVKPQPPIPPIRLHADPMRATLELGEMLVQILGFLPMQDLLLVQRVCRQWRDQIRGSPLLQRLLFLQPVPIPAIRWLDWRYDRQDMYAEPIGEPLVPSGGSIREYPPHWGRTRNDNGQFRVFVNPLLAKHLRMLSDLVLDGLAHNNSTGMQRPEASWRKMLVTQPPVHTMVVEHERLDATVRWGEERGCCLEACFRRLHGIAWLKGRSQMEMFTGVEDLGRILKTGVQ